MKIGRRGFFGALVAGVAVGMVGDKAQAQVDLVPTVDLSGVIEKYGNVKVTVDHGTGKTYYITDASRIWKPHVVSEGTLWERD